MPLSRRATTVLLPPRPGATVDGFRNRVGVRVCNPFGHLLLHHPRELFRLSAGQFYCSRESPSISRGMSSLAIGSRN